MTITASLDPDPRNREQVRQRSRQVLSHLSVTLDRHVSAAAGFSKVTAARAAGASDARRSSSLSPPIADAPARPLAEERDVARATGMGKGRLRSGRFSLPAR